LIDTCEPNIHHTTATRNKIQGGYQPPPASEPVLFITIT
jgi:hypothetical protein